MTVPMWIATTQTTANADEGRRQLLIWGPILVALLVLAFGAYSLFTRWMKSDDTTGRAEGFSLSDLRAMHKAGKISDEEFEKTRSMMVSAAKRMVSTVPDIKPKRPISNPPTTSGDSTEGPIPPDQAGPA